MNDFQIKSYNPYIDLSGKTNFSSNDSLVSNPITQDIVNQEDMDLSERVINLGEKWVSKNYEKYIDRLGMAIRIADWSVFGFAASLQGIVIAGSIWRSHFDIFGPKFMWQFFPTLIKILAVPFAIVFLVCAVFEGIHEIIHIKRTAQLLVRLNSNAPIPHQLDWIQNKYFSLDYKEIRSITDYIEWIDEGHSIEEKRNHFEGVADKLLKIKYESLKRRITPWLAEEVAQKLPNLIKNLQHNDATIRNEALKQAQDLIENVDTQGKKQILLYVLSLLAIGLTTAGMIATIVLSGGTALFAFSGLAAFIMLIRFILEKGMMPEKGWHFSTDHLIPHFNAPKKEIIAEKIA